MAPSHIQRVWRYGHCQGESALSLRGQDSDPVSADLFHSLWEWGRARVQEKMVFVEGWMPSASVSLSLPSAWHLGPGVDIEGLHIDQKEIIPVAEELSLRTTVEFVFSWLKPGSATWWPGAFLLMFPGVLFWRRFSNVRSGRLPNWELWGLFPVPCTKQEW